MLNHFAGLHLREAAEEVRKHWDGWLTMLTKAEHSAQTGPQSFLTAAPTSRRGCSTRPLARFGEYTVLDPVAAILASIRAAPLSHKRCKDRRFHKSPIFPLRFSAAKPPQVELWIAGDHPPFDFAKWRILVVPNQRETAMSRKAQSVVLTKSQAACLIALRNGKVSKPEIAIHRKLDVIKTASALRALARFGLAKQDRAKRWTTTTSGKICRFKTVPDKLRRNSQLPGPGGRRLLKLLDQPMRGNEIVEKLGISHQRVRQLVIKLHAQGHVSFGDQEKPFWIIRRAGDVTPLLSRDEEHVLSIIPREYVTNVTKIRLAARMTKNKVRTILKRLVASRFVDESEGLYGGQVYRLSEAGKNHPQRDQSARRATIPRLPVESDRVRRVLSEIFDSGALRIRDVTNALSIPRESINALMQYLKRKGLVKKTGRDFNSPYSLTDEGRSTLVEMTRRLAA